MVFNSALFFIFFAGVLAVYLSPVSAHWRRCFLLLANYLFFASYYPPYVFLLAASTSIDWWLANRIDASKNPTQRQWWLVGSLVLNIGALAFFKLTPFVAAQAGIHAPITHLIIPVGISFYTFQALSYTIDVYRKRIPVEPSLINFALFVSFFPHLVSGPILRARDILPQCQHIHRPTWQQFSWGGHLLLWGLVEKCLLADECAAPIANAVFKTGAPLSGLDAWAGTMAFALQLFFDFTGYSTCAIGVALCLGFVIPLNFHFPFGASGFMDFWRRWHMSLSSWLRDYLYISLGGNRGGRWQTHRNVMITMILGGLWHGANWTFLLWGTLHGLFVALEHELRAVCQQWRVTECRFMVTLGQRVGWLWVLYGWLISMVLFRASTLKQAFTLLGLMHHPALTANGILAWPAMVFTGVLFGGVVLIHRLMRHSSLEAMFGRLPGPVQVLTSSLLLLLLILYVKKGQPFMYVQF